MRVLKRFVAAFAVMCTLFCTIAVCGNAQEGETELAALLTDLGIYQSTDDMELSSNTLTREEAAGILSVFYGVTAADYPMQTPFADVTENWSSGHIMTMVSVGVMNGYDDGLFYPQRPVAVSETVKMLVTMTGYQLIAENRGGYPAGYMAAASSCGIVKKPLSNIAEPITKGEFTELLFNAIRVDMLEQTTAGKKNYFESERGKNLLSERLSIYEVMGTVNALPHTSLDYRDAPGRDKIRIDDVNYICKKDAEPFLGMCVKAYYRQMNGETTGEIVSIEAMKNRSHYVEVDAKNIQEVTKTSAGVRFSYEEGSTTKSVTLPKDVVVIFNGMRKTYYTAEQHLFPKQGMVRLLDTNNDGSYESAVVSCFVNYFVKNVTEDSGTLYITDQSGKTPIVIDTKNQDVTCRVYQSGRAISPEEIEENDIISVAADLMDFDGNAVQKDANYIKIYRSNLRASGVLSRIDSDGVELDGRLFELAKDFNAAEYTLPLGEEVTVYLNYNGAICASGVTDSQRGDYAILQAISVRSAIDETATLKLFTQNGQFVKLACADGIRIDGYSKREFKNVADYLKSTAAQFERETQMGKNSSGVWQLVTYTLTPEGTVKTLDTIRSNKRPAEHDLSFFGATQRGETSYFLGGGGCINSQFGVTEKTIFFAVGDANDENDYSFVSYADIPNTESVQYHFFDADNMNVSAVAIRTGVRPSASIGSNEMNRLMVFERLTTKINDDGSAAPFICGRLLDKGTEAVLELTDESLLANGGDEIVPGNFIRWAVNGEGVICKLEKVLDINITGTPKSSFNNTARFSHGIAKKMSDSYIVTTFRQSDEVFDEPSKLGNVKNIYIFNSRSGRLTDGALSDIRVSEQYGAEADSIGIFYRSGTIRAIVIYR